MLELRNLFIRDYSHLPIVGVRWLDAFEKMPNLKSSLVYELSGITERAAEPMLLESKLESKIKTEGIALVYASNCINALFNADVWSYLVEKKFLFPKYNTDLFIESDISVKELRIKLKELGSHRECFIKLASKPIEILLIGKYQDKETEVKTILKKMNLKIKIIKKDVM